MAFQVDTFQNDTFQIIGGTTSSLFRTSSLNGLSVMGPFFADPLAIAYEEEPVTRFRSFAVNARRAGLPHEA
jgi:hypothetical protein